MATASELPINTNASALDMANAIFGEGVSVVGATYTGDNRSSGIYTNGDAVAPGVTPADSGVMLSTGRLSAFTNRNGDPNTSGSTTTGSNGENNNADFNALAGTNTYDASYLDVDVIPVGDTITLQFVFSSEEYPEYAGSIYNDVVGIWVNGVEAEMAVGDGTTSVSNVNNASNQNLYVDNTGDDYNTEMDGFTVTMTVKMTVIPDQVNTIRIGIADVGDSSYDSTLLIAAESGQAALIAEDDEVNVAPGETRTFDVLANDSGPSGGTIYISHVNGVEVAAGDVITLSTGQEITLNADGTFTVQADADLETVNFSYTVANSVGNLSDTAYVTINSVPCFVAGTLVETPCGMVPVEDLSPGDLVLTRDCGAQPLRWIGQRRVSARGHLAPIRFEAGAYGDHNEIWLSPQHRVLFQDALAELLFGETEVLVAAKDLVNDQSVRRVEGGDVTYVHLLFDRHQVIYTEGLATESYLPGPQTVESFDAEIVDEIFTLFPEVDLDNGRGFPSAARRMLKPHEAQLLMSWGEGV